MLHHLLVRHGYVARVARATTERRGLRLPGTSSSSLAATPEGGASAGPAALEGCSFAATPPASGSGWAGLAWAAAVAAAGLTSTPWRGEELAVALSTVALATSLLVLLQ